MDNKQREAQIYAAFLKSIRKVGLKAFKETTLFGRNDQVEEIGEYPKLCV